MNNSAPFKSLVMSAVAMGALCLGAGLAEAGYLQTNLVSDIPGLATITDPTLQNSWGVSRMISPTSPFWISNQANNTTTLYAVTGTTTVSKININPPSGFVAIPTTAMGPQGPTGQVSNTNALSFAVGNGGDSKPARFIFANLNGTISAWDGGQSAIVQWATPGANYTGLAINQTQTMLYAANDAGAGGINVFDSSFKPTLAGAFATPSNISALGLVPFNVQDIGGNVFVTYALAGHNAQTSAGVGDGALAVFTENGVLEPGKTKIGDQFASPWGIALAPASFGKFGGDLLVGNFSFDHSEINAFDPSTWAFEGSIGINAGPGDMPGGLWSLTFGGGGLNGSPNTLYFTDGINHEAAGLFGAIQSVPEPSTWVLMLAGFGALGFAAYRTKKGAASAAFTG
jgi:uncharacterized protein (TIGR03118 family)